jgi:hypothetical protein
MEDGADERMIGCSRFEVELEAYMEGEAKPFVVSHAQDCPLCGAVLLDLERIRMVAHALPEVDPSPAVWANIRAVLAQEGALRPQRQGWRRLLNWQFLPNPATAAVLAGLVAFGLMLTTPTGHLSRWDPARTSVASTTDVRTTFANLSTQDNALAQVVEELEETFKANQANLAPDMKATYQKSLESLDTSIQECLASLQEQPDNRLAHDYLLTAYTRKAEVLSSALEYEGR